MTGTSGPGTLASFIAHRGASGDAPENTLVAMKLAAEQGAQCVEIDVSISRDGVPFVHHDDKLDRCTTGKGLLCEHDAEQLDKLDASKLMPKFRPEPLPRLTALIQLLDTLNLGLNLEIKPRSGLEEPTVDAICDVLDQHWPERLPLVFSSFNQKSLNLAQMRAPWIARALLVGGLPQDWQALLIKYDCCNLHAHEAKLDPKTVEAVKAADVGLYAYTVNDAQRATTLLNWGVDGVFTDHPRQMLKYQLT